MHQVQTIYVDLKRTCVDGRPTWNMDQSAFSVERTSRKQRTLNVCPTTLCYPPWKVYKECGFPYMHILAICKIWVIYSYHIVRLSDGQLFFIALPKMYLKLNTRCVSQMMNHKRKVYIVLKLLQNPHYFNIKSALIYIPNWRVYHQITYKTKLITLY